MTTPTESAKGLTREQIEELYTVHELNLRVPDHHMRSLCDMALRSLEGPRSARGAYVTVPRSILRGLCRYGHIHPIEGVLYPEGGHQYLLNEAENALAAPPAAPVAQEAVAWMIEHTFEGVEYKNCFCHNAIGYYRKIDPNAKVTPLYADPQLAVTEETRVPAVLFDGFRVFQEVRPLRGTHVTAQNVADVLDAVVRLMRSDMNSREEPK